MAEEHRRKDSLTQAATGGVMLGAGTGARIALDRRLRAHHASSSTSAGGRTLLQGAKRVHAAAAKSPRPVPLPSTKRWRAGVHIPDLAGRSAARSLQAVGLPLAAYGMVNAVRKKPNKVKAQTRGELAHHVVRQAAYIPSVERGQEVLSEPLRKDRAKEDAHAYLRSLPPGRHRVQPGKIDAGIAGSGLRVADRAYVARMAVSGPIRGATRFAVHPDGTVRQVDGAHRYAARNMRGHARVPVEIEHTKEKAGSKGAKVVYRPAKARLQRGQRKRDRAMDPAKMKRLADAYPDWADPVNQKLSSVGKLLSPKEQRKLDRHRRFGRTASLVGGTLGLSALALRSPSGAKTLVRHVPGSKVLAGLARHEEAAVRHSNTLGIGAIGTGALGSFNYAAQQKLERKATAPVDKSHRLPGSKTVYRAGARLAERGGRVVDRGVAEVNGPGSDRAVVRGVNRTWRGTTQIAAGLNAARHSDLVVGGGLAAGAGGGAYAYHRRKATAPVGKGLASFAGRALGTTKRSLTPNEIKAAAKKAKESAGSHAEDYFDRRALNLARQILPEEGGRATSRAGAAYHYIQTPADPKKRRWGARTVGTMLEAPGKGGRYHSAGAMQTQVAPTKHLVITGMQVHKPMRGKGIGTQVAGDAMQNLKTAKTPGSLWRSGTYDASQGGGGPTGSRTWRRQGIKYIPGMAYGKPGQVNIRSAVAEGKLTPKQGNQARRHVLRSRVGLATPVGLRKLPQATQTHLDDQSWWGRLPGGQPMLGKTRRAAAGGAVVGGAGYGAHRYREDQHPRAYGGKFSQKNVAKRDDRFLRGYKERISPNAESGYKTLKRGRNDQVANAGGSATMAGLSGWLLHHELKHGPRMSRNPGALIAGAGIAAGALNTEQNLRGAKRYNDKLGKIKSKARSRRAQGLYGPGRGLDPVDMSSARAKALSKSLEAQMDARATNLAQAYAVNKGFGGKLLRRGAKSAVAARPAAGGPPPAAWMKHDPLPPAPRGPLGSTANRKPETLNRFGLTAAQHRTAQVRAIDARTDARAAAARPARKPEDHTNYQPYVGSYGQRPR